MIESNESIKVVAMAGVGLLGGIVRVCSSDKPLSPKAMIGSLMVSTFAAGITGALLHEKISDPIYLSAISGMTGYCGQVAIAILSRVFETRIRIFLGDK